ncbi:MAG: NifU family protein [Streptosporangiales bacterium]|nr:NifU family protein [Streptosporangiales bacterium]MBO0889997.1 NifU family protein [Acidothermales bacterium]
MAGDDARALSARLDTLLEGLEDLPDPDVAGRVDELVGAIVELYGTGLERMVRSLCAEDGGEERVRRLARDDLVAHLLLLHDLHPDDVDTRVQRALDEVRPYLGSHAGGVEYGGVDAAGVAHLRLEGSCDGCPSSSVTVKLAVERAVLEAAPEVGSVEVEGMVGSEDTLPLLQIQPFKGSRPGESDGGASDGAWQALELTVTAGRVQGVRLGDLDVVVCNVAGTPYAYRDACPQCAGVLHDGALDGDLLACPGCGCRYDVRLAGRGDGVPASLEALPVLPDGSGWRIAVPSAASA